jgi:predicted acyl esterase
MATDPLGPVPAGLDPLSDESAVEDRRDVLCFTSEPLGRDLIVTGQPIVTAVVAADVATHDLIATLTMVEPGGGVTPGDPSPTTVELSPISWRVPAGHRLRLDLSASRFPAFDRNPQNWAVAAHRAGPGDCRVAAVEIHAARLELPVEDDA